MFLRQSTSQIIRFGPCLDAGDGVNEETALTLAQADMRLSKDGGAFAQKNATGNATHDSDGWYSTTLNTTDTNTVGELILNVHQPANMLPVWKTYWVIEEAVYDDLFGAAGAGYAGITELADVPTVAEFNARTLVAASYFDPAADTVATVTTLTNLPAITANWLTAAGINADAITAAKVAADVHLEAADAVWDEPLAGHVGADSAGLVLNDWQNGGRLDLILDAIPTTAMRGTDSAALASVCTEARLSELDAGTGGKAANQIDIIQTDTTTDIPALLPAALVGGRMDSNMSAINNSNAAAIQQALAANTIEDGACEGTPTVLAVQTDLAETQDDIYIGRTVIFTSGAARGEGAAIDDYTGSTGTLHFAADALANAPSASDTFILI